MIHARYSAPADLFSLMDSTSNWRSGFVDPAYHKAWKRRFGWSSEDRTMAERYKQYRKRTYHDRAETDAEYRNKVDGLFATRSSYAAETDPLGAHFISAATIDEALATLNEIASPEDAAMLRGFYEHFRPKWRVLLKESEAFAARAQALDSDLSRAVVNAFLARVARFYNVDIDIVLNAYLVWWPPIERTRADNVAGAFLLHINPEKHADDAEWDEIIMHEAIHYISAAQEPAQKRTLTRTFQNGCSAKTSNRYHLLEEPLAIAWGQAAYSKYVREKQLDPADNWYRAPMAGIMGRLLWLNVDDLYEGDTTINDGIIDEAAKYCARIIQIRKTVH